MIAARAFLALVVLSGLLYLPTFGVGDVGAPNAPAQAALIIPSLIAAAGTVIMFLRSGRLATPATTLLTLSGVTLSATALLGPDPVSGGIRGVWFAAMAVSIAGGVELLGRQQATQTIILTTAAFVAAGVFLDPVLDVRADLFEIVIEGSIFPWPRFRGIGANQAVIGYSGAMVVIGASVVMEQWRLPHRIILGLVGVIGVLASHNRSAIGIIIGALAAELIWRRNRRSFAALGTLAIMAAVLVLQPSVLSVLDRNAQEVTIVDYYGGTNEGLLTGRTEVWESAIDHANANVLLGRGNGSFAELNDIEFERLSERWAPGHAHNLLVELYVDQGIVGVLVFTAAIVSIIARRRLWLPGTMALLAAFLLHSVVESVAQRIADGSLAVLALIAAAATDQSDSRNRSSHSNPRSVAVEQPTYSPQPAGRSA